MHNINHILKTSGTDINNTFIKDLNYQQLKAVVHKGSPLLVIAGAGSGKTLVLTRRIAYLLSTQNIRPDQIMAITFTNKAANEMRERIVQLIGTKASSIWVSTFHSTCVRILRKQASLLTELNSNFSIYDVEDSRRLFASIIKDMGLSSKKYSLQFLANKISRLKTELIRPSQMCASFLDKTLFQVYSEYQLRLRTANALDFDDLINETIYILKTFPDVGRYYRNKFQYILIDEYQDTNLAQYTLINELVDNTLIKKEGTRSAELCAVGDSDQSIYAFRGATIRNIEAFENDYPNSKIVFLEQNYRSTQIILNLANVVINPNISRRKKLLWTEKEKGEPVIGYAADNEQDEANFIAEEIVSLSNKNRFTYNDIAICYRTNNLSRVLEEALIHTSVPYKVIGSVKFYERREIRETIAYLRAISNSSDLVSIRRILNVPRRGIGERTEKYIAIYAEKKSISFDKALQIAADREISQLSSKANKNIEKFLEILDNLIVRHNNNEDIGCLVQNILEQSGYKQILQNSGSPQDLVRLDNIYELAGVARKFGKNFSNLELLKERSNKKLILKHPSSKSCILAKFLEQTSLVTDVDELTANAEKILEKNTNMVTLMTLHSVKGLEFPVVFIAGWEEGTFPHARSLKDINELAEERRLAYVGITRAKKKLYLSHAKVRSSWKECLENPLSRFLNNISKDLINWDYTQKSLKSKIIFNKKLIIAKFELGDRVNHDKYGLGYVEKVLYDNGSIMLIVNFGTFGKVKLMHNSSFMQKL